MMCAKLQIDLLLLLIYSVGDLVGRTSEPTIKNWLEGSDGAGNIRVGSLNFSVFDKCNSAE